MRVDVSTTVLPLFLRVAAKSGTRLRWAAHRFVVVANGHFTVGAYQRKQAVDKHDADMNHVPMILHSMGWVKKPW